MGISNLKMYGRKKIMEEVFFQHKGILDQRLANNGSRAKSNRPAYFLK